MKNTKKMFLLLNLLVAVFSLQGMPEANESNPVDTPDSRPVDLQNGPGFLILLNQTGSFGVNINITVSVVPTGSMPQNSTTPFLYSVTVGEQPINFQLNEE